MREYVEASFVMDGKAMAVREEFCFDDRATVTEAYNAFTQVADRLFQLLWERRDEIKAKKVVGCLGSCNDSHGNCHSHLSNCNNSLGNILGGK